MGAEKYKPERIFTKRKRIFVFIIEMRYNFKLAVNTLGYGLQLNHLSDRTVLGCHILPERNMFVAEHFLSSLVKEYGK